MTMGPDVASIDVTEAERRQREDPAGSLLIDVREQYEFDEVRAPGAILMPMSGLAARIGELPSDRPLMIVCKSGSRSAAVAGFLARSGRHDVVNVAGGMDDWERRGLPVKRGAPEPGEGSDAAAASGRDE